MDENKATYVLDASTVLKWILIEDKYMKQALKLREGFLNDKYNVFVPSHFLSEICNTLGRKDSSAAVDFMSNLMLGGIFEHRLTPELAALALDLMQRHKGVSFYDTFYHAIALQKGLEFITADEKYYRLMSGEGNIRLLKDYA